MPKYELIESELGNTYIRWNDESVIRFIPMDESNSDYQAYLKYLEENK